MENKNKKIGKDDLQKYLDNISINSKDLLIQNLILGSFDDQKRILDSIEQFIREYKAPKVDKYTMTIDRVYSGKVGCMCGCLGNYSSEKIAIGRMTNFFAKLIAEGRESAIEKADDGQYWYYEYETPAGQMRCKAIYFKKEVAQ